MIVFLNGKFVPEEQAVVSIFDRGFLYGDGLLEGIRVYGGTPFLWAEHMERLRRGAEALKIAIPFGPEELRGCLAELVRANALPEAFARITLSRGIGQRGYSPRGAHRPVLAMSLHPLPATNREAPSAWKLTTSTIRLPTHDPLALHKTCNKLRQVLARAEADAAGAQEALMLNTEDSVVEATSSNLFWIDGQTVCTAPLPAGVLAGTTRAFVLALCARLGVERREVAIGTDELFAADGVFLTSCAIEAVEAEELDGRPLRRSALFPRLRDEYRQAVEEATKS